MAMVMVMLMVMVPKALSQVGWLRQRQCHSINRLNPSIGWSFHKLRVQSAQRFGWKCYSCRSSALSSVALKQSLKKALKQALSGSQAGLEAATRDALNECVSTSEDYRQSRMAEVCRLPAVYSPIVSRADVSERTMDGYRLGVVQGFKGSLLCAARVRVAQSIVDSHFCWWMVASGQAEWMLGSGRTREGFRWRGHSGGRTGKYGEKLVRFKYWISLIKLTNHRLIV